MLKIFSKLSEADQVELLKHLNCEGCDAFIECIHNARFNPSLDAADKKLLQPLMLKNEKAFRLLNAQDTDPQVKRKKLHEIAPYLGLIVNIVLPALEVDLSGRKKAKKKEKNE